MADFKVRVTAETTGVQQAISKVNSSLDSVKRTAASVGSAVKAAMGPLLMIGAAVGGAAAVGGKALLDLGGDLQDLSDVTGIAVDQLVVLRDAFKRAGMSVEDIQPLLVKMTNTLANPSDKTTKALNDLGLSLTVLKSLSIEEQFKMIGAAIGGLKDPAEKITASLAIFGKSGSNLVRLFKDVNVFKDSEKNVGGFAARMKELAPSLESLGDAIDSISDKLLAFWAELAGGSSDKIDSLTAWIEEADFTPWAKKIRDTFDTLFKDAESSSWGVAIGTMLSNIIQSQGMKDAVGLLFEGVINTLKGLLGETPGEQAATAAVGVGTVAASVGVWEALKFGADKMWKSATVSKVLPAPFSAGAGGLPVAEGGTIASRTLPSLAVKIGSIFKPIAAIAAVAASGYYGGKYFGNKLPNIADSSRFNVPDVRANEDIRAMMIKNGEVTKAKKELLLLEERQIKEQTEFYKKFNADIIAKNEAAKKTEEALNIRLEADAAEALAKRLMIPSNLAASILEPSLNVTRTPVEPPKMESMIFDAYKPVVSSLERIGGAAGLSGESMPSLQKIANNFLQQIVKNTTNLNVQAAWA